MYTPKYGASNRKLVDKAVRSKRKRYECPKCNKLKLSRKGNAQWQCRSCDSIFAGGSYSFRTEAGEIARRLISEY
jgi:ribosomal protein L37AE/L43A